MDGNPIVVCTPEMEFRLELGDAGIALTRADFALLVGTAGQAIGTVTAGVAEPVDAQVSKTCSRKGVSVRSRPPAPFSAEIPVLTF